MIASTWTAALEPRPILDVARQLGIDRRHLIPYGDDKAKIRLEARHSGRPPGRLILVSAITPTGSGEGKTTTSIGLAQGLARLGHNVCLALREPSLGPTFGMKGGATGGGKAVLVPAEDINLHFTGDFHAVTAAHNLLASLLDNHIHHGNVLEIDPRRVFWRRVLDVNDRALRHVVIGLGGALEGVPRETGFDITAASEVMAALCLAEDAEDLRARLGRLLVALTVHRKPVTAADLQAVGAMMVLLKDALLPNLVQTLRGRAGVRPRRSVRQHRPRLQLGDRHQDGACLCRLGGDRSGLRLRSRRREVLRHQVPPRPGSTPRRWCWWRPSGRSSGTGTWRRTTCNVPDPSAVERGLAQPAASTSRASALFGESPVVALNRFGTDSDDEIDVVRAACAAVGVPFAVSDIFEHGGVGGIEMAETVLEHAEHTSVPFRPLYDRKESVKTKMATIAREMYGAREVAYTAAAERDLKLIRKLGYEELPLCVAKTPTSLSDDPAVTGRPEDFGITVRGFILAAGAGYVVPLLGDILRMPGLPVVPQAVRMDLVDSRVVGLLGG